MATAMVTVVEGSDGFTKKYDRASWGSDMVLDQNHEYTRDSTPLVQWMVDEHGVFTLSEGDGLATLGFEPGGVVGESVFDVYAEVPQILENVRRTLKGEVVIDTVELAGQIWDSRYYPVRGHNGEISGIVGTAFNITERQNQVREQAAIVNVASALRKAANRAEMPHIILTKLTELLEADSTALLFQNTSNDEIIIELVQGVIWASDSQLILEKTHAQLVSNSKHVITTGQPYIDSKYLQIPNSDEEFAVAGIPLIAQEYTIGVLWVCRKAPFSESALHLLIAIGDMAANAFRRATQHERTERRLQRIAALHAIDQAITSSLDLRVTLSVLLDQVVRQLDVDAADVLLHNPQLQRLQFSDGRGFHLTDKTDVSLRLGEGLAGQIALTRQFLSVSNLNQTGYAIARESLVEDENFIAYFGVPLIAKGKLKGVLEIFHRKPLNAETEWVDFLKALATQAAIAIYNAELFADIQRSNVELDLAYIATLEGWVRALDLRDKSTEGHTQRVTRRTVELARSMGMSEKDLVHVHRGALLHDIGKIGIPDHILKKPGPLSEKEWKLMHMHPVYAYEMLSQIDFLRPALDIPYCHHEKWNGTGYPQGLKEGQIPLIARIFAVIDVWDALSSDRPYRKAWPQGDIYEHIVDQAGEHFDPKVVETWLKVFNIPPQ